MSDVSFSIDEIDFGLLEEAFEDNSFEVSYFLDLRENGLVMLGDYIDFPGVEESEKEIEGDTEGRFLKVPRGDSRVAWQDMKKFALSLDDEELSSQLLDEIQGSGAFRRFKDRVFERGVREKWFRFRDRRVRRRVLDWLMAEELITEEQSQNSMEKLEQEIKWRKNRQHELEEMGDGDIVECRDTAGHPGLSQGSCYHVLSERSAEDLIQVNDDNGKQSWYPKTQFELKLDG